MSTLGGFWVGVLVGALYALFLQDWWRQHGKSVVKKLITDETGNDSAETKPPEHGGGVGE